MKLTFSFALLLFFSCGQKSKNFEETLEIANELHSRYFINALKVYMQEFAHLVTKKFILCIMYLSMYEIIQNSMCLSNNVYPPVFV